MGPMNPDKSHQGWVEGKTHHPWSAGNTPPNAAVGLLATGHLCCKGTSLPHGQLVHQDAQDLFLQNCSPVFGPTAYTGVWSFPPSCRTFHFPLLNSIRFPVFHFSSLWRSLWIAAQPYCLSTIPPGFLPSADLLVVYLVPSSGSLTKMLNSIRTSIDLWDTMLVTGLQLDFTPVIFEPGSSASFQFTSLAMPLSRTVYNFNRLC